MLKGNLVETLFLKQLWITFVSFSSLTEAKGIHRPNSRNLEYFKISHDKLESSSIARCIMGDLTISEACSVCSCKVSVTCVMQL